jgi:hypothetical protein
MLARNLLAVFAVAVAIPAAAQQAAPAAAPAAAVHNCKKPGEHPGRLASDNMRRSWTKEANGFLDCLKKFALDQQAIAKPLFDQAKPHQDAANAAIEEHNKAATELRKIVEEMS